MNKKFDVIVILGGGLKKNQKGDWKTTNLNEGDSWGPIDDRLRVLAGSYLFKKGLTDLIIVSGGKGQYQNTKGAPSVSRVMRRELIKLGVPSKKLEEESHSNNTYQQLIEIEKIIKGRPMKKVALISNDHHLPRIRAMLKYLPRLGDMKNKVKLVSAEKILLKINNKKWAGIIKKGYASRAMRERIKLEQRGIYQIKRGVYKFQKQK